MAKTNICSLTFCNGCADASYCCFSQVNGECICVTC